MKSYVKSVGSVIFVGLLLSACGKSSSPDRVEGNPAAAPSKVADAQIPPIVIETGSPDLAVKSWWRVFDLKEKIDTEECNKVKSKEKPVYFSYLSKVSQADVLNSFSPSPVQNYCFLSVYDRALVSG